ncbi:hypothetical protein Golob_023966, partial [Gossypium lobatum]|nr:hypothetical protein [Gossypium lobatum]
MGNLPSLTWNSIWAANGLLLKGLSWRVGRGNAISIWIDQWILGIEPESWLNRGGNGELELVSDLIDSTSKMWKTKIITTTFQMDIAQRILQIPLAIIDCEDMQVWKGEHSGEFSVRSAYKLLQDASLDPSSYLLILDTREWLQMLVVLDAAPKKKTATTCFGNVLQALMFGI